MGGFCMGYTREYVTRPSLGTCQRPRESEYFIREDGGKERRARKARRVRLIIIAPNESFFLHQNRSRFS